MTKKTIITTAFFVVLIATLIMFCVGLHISMEYESTNDDIFGSYLTPFLGFIFLLPLLMAEFIVFKSILYFVSNINKSINKTVLKIASLFFCFIIFSMYAVIIFSISGSWVLPIINKYEIEILSTSIGAVLIIEIIYFVSTKKQIYRKV